MRFAENDARDLHHEVKQHAAQSKFMHQHFAQLQLNATSVHAVEAYIRLANEVEARSKLVCALMFVCVLV